MEVNVWRHTPTALPRGRKTGTHAIGGRMGPRVGMGYSEKIPLHLSRDSNSWMSNPQP